MKALADLAEITDRVERDGVLVYRSNTAGGPFINIASTTSTYSTYLDTAVVNGTTYYYMVMPTGASGGELCQSNEVSARPTAR